MLVGNLASANYFSLSNLAKIEKSREVGSVVAKPTDFEYSDSYIPSNNVKAKNLTEIKSRISKGFYNSNEVNEDLTELFSNVFKRAIS